MTKLKVGAFSIWGGAIPPEFDVEDFSAAFVRFENGATLILEVRPHAQECVEFAQAVVDGAPSPVPAEQSLQITAILDGVYRSQAAGGEVAIE